MCASHKFADDAYRTPEELLYGETSPVVRRRVNDGSRYDVVKVPHQPVDLERHLGQLGWNVAVTQTAAPFYWGAGSRKR